jgi:hypothetical protein
MQIMLRHHVETLENPTRFLRTNVHIFFHQQLGKLRHLNDAILINVINPSCWKIFDD